MEAHWESGYVQIMKLNSWTLKRKIPEVDLYVISDFTELSCVCVKSELQLVYTI